MNKKNSVKIFSFILIAIICALLITYKFGRIKKIFKSIGMKSNKLTKQEIKNKLASLFIFNIHGKKLGKIAKRFIEKYKPGGIIIMSPNVKDVKTLKQLINQIRKVYNNKSDPLMPLIAIDQEGGRVKRIKKGIPQFPSAMEAANKGEEYVYNLAQKTNKALFDIGININFAPVADVLINKRNKVIGNRAFSSDETIAAKMVKSYLKGAIKTGIITCAKHFPGHGSVKSDSHKTLPVDKSKINELKLKPFISAIENHVHMIMIAHILFPELDNVPSTFSKKIIGMLRNKYNFHGIIISDDLNMGALKKNYNKEQVIINALKAGVDMFIHTSIKYGTQIKLLNKTADLIIKDVNALIALDRAVKNINKIKDRVRKNFY